MDDVDYCPQLNAPQSISSEQQDEEIHEKRNMLKWTQITITETDSRHGLNALQLQDTYTVYCIELKVTDKNVPGYDKEVSTVWRRYSEFETLHDYLGIIYPFIIIPPLPEKRATFAWQQMKTDRFDMEFINRRRIALEKFLLRIASHPILSEDEWFLKFIKQSDDSDRWNCNILMTNYKSKGEWKVKEYSASLRVHQTNDDFENIKQYASDLNMFISSILKIRASMMDSTYGLHKTHANYGRVYSEWSGLHNEPAADCLQIIGHFMDSFSNSVDGSLDDEEQFADHLKEYIAFSDSLKFMYRKQQLMQLDLEKLEELSLAKQNEREQLISPSQSNFSISSMKSRLFGGETEDQKKSREKALDLEIESLAKQLDDQQTAYNDFIQKALKDYERFKRQKIKDINDILTNYAILQIDRCKKGITMWENMKDSAINKM